MDPLRTPLLTAREAARHLGMPESTLDNWIAAPRDGIPLIHAVDPERRGWPRMPFVAIVEAYVLRSLRDLGLSLDHIRLAAHRVRSELGDEYALATRRIASDGVAIFLRMADESLIDVRDGQLPIREALDEHLRFISWGEDGSPTRLQLRQYPQAAAVVIDPRFGWGAPVLAGSKVPVESMVDLWRTGEPMSVVAAEFDLPLDVVEDVLRVAA